MQKIKIFIITLKDSPRIGRLKKRFKSLKIKYQIIYGYDSREISEKETLELYNKEKTFNTIGRYLTKSEICISASHLKVYDEIVNKKIKEAIIMEDDSYPSKKIVNYVKNYHNINDNEIISFVANPNGFLEKKNTRVSNGNIKLHRAKTHLYSSGIYHINLNTCKKIIKITNKIVSSFPDWQFLLKKNNIKILMPIPFLALINDRGFSYLQESRNKILRKKYLPNNFFFNFLRDILHLSFFPYILGLYKNKEYYLEYFFLKSLTKFKNFFTHKYFDLEKIYYNKNFYTSDLKKNVESQIKQNYSYKIKIKKNIINIF